MPTSLEAIYRDHFDYVYRIARRLAGPLLDAEDVTQDVFVVVGRKLHTFDGTSLITTWLYAITVNVVRGLRRRAWLRALWELQDDDAQAETPVEALDEMDLFSAHRIAYRILDKMAAPKREAFILAEFAGLSCDEIARIEGVKTETIWSRLHYARKEFSRRLAALKREE